MTQRIVITRPAHQANLLVNGIKAAAGEVCLFPTLDISPVTLTPTDKQHLQNINDYDIIIFISPNAVEYGLKHIENASSITDKTVLATIGKSSANQLAKRLGRLADIVPDSEFNSEGLLATAAMKNVSDKNILIVRGNAGREHLKDSLQQRGAKVDYLSVYQRTQPDTSSAEIEQHLQNNQIAAIVITSATSLKNMLEMVPEKAHASLLKIPLVLINKRLSDVAESLGFAGPFYIASQASDEAIVAVLKKHKLLSVIE